MKEKELTGIRDRMDQPKGNVKQLKDNLNKMREQMKRMEKNIIDVGRQPDEACNKISGPMKDELYDAIEFEKEPESRTLLAKKTETEAEIQEIHQLLM